jgi:hypothetical protein
MPVGRRLRRALLGWPPTGSSSRPGRGPAVAQPFGVRVAVLGDDRGDAFGMPGGDPEPDRRAVVEHVQREAVEAEHFRQAIDGVGDVLERVVEVTSGGHVRLAEAGQVGSNEVKPVGEQRDQLAEHVARGRETVQEHQRGCVPCSGLPVEHRQRAVRWPGQPRAWLLSARLRVRAPDLAVARVPGTVGVSCQAGSV